MKSALPAPYRQFVDVLACHPLPPSTSVLLCGSVCWGDLTTLRDGTPVSDVDLLIVGPSLAELRTAAAELAMLFRPFQRAEAPLFKLGMKLRLDTELTKELLTTNELAALQRGRLMCGKRHAIEAPGSEWCRRQADLVVPTRLVCNATQAERIAGHRDESALRRYLAARTLLDLPSITLRHARELGHSYDHRVAQFCRAVDALPFSTGERRELRHLLGAALRTKRKPQDHACGSLPAAEATLELVARRAGVAAEAADRTVFWTSRRPLDVRDWQLRQLPS